MAVMYCTPSTHNALMCSQVDPVQLEMGFVIVFKTGHMEHKRTSSLSISAKTGKNIQIFTIHPTEE